MSYLALVLSTLALFIAWKWQVIGLRGLSVSRSEWPPLFWMGVGIAVICWIIFAVMIAMGH